MGRAKLPRKSTSVDMTAMCDVAFLLLSFFILATKPKPQEVVPVTTPTSVSTAKVAEDKVMVIFNKDGKVFLTIDDVDKRKEVLENINQRFTLGLTPTEIANSKQALIFGTPIGSLKSYMANVAQLQAKSDALPGIPVDSTNNQLKEWLSSVNIVYTGSKPNLSLKGDNVAKYPAVKGVLDAFKSNEMLKFNIITSEEGLDHSTDLYKKAAAEKAKS